MQIWLVRNQRPSQTRADETQDSRTSCFLMAYRGVIPQRELILRLPLKEKKKKSVTPEFTNKEP